MAHAGGRPTKYDESMVAQIYTYLETVGREQTKLPKRVDIALKLGVHEETLIEWAKEHVEFSDALSRVDGLQKSQLMDDGMYGGKEVNAKIAQFLLGANHGMIAPDKNIISGDPDNPIRVDIDSALSKIYGNTQSGSVDPMSTDSA
jgi:hypothetical protein